MSEVREDRAARLTAALAQAVRRDQQAFAEIVEEYQAMVFSIAYHFLRDRGTAEDVAQEVFLKLYQNLASIQSAAHLTFWLRRVTVHQSISQGRRKKTRSETALEDAPEPFSANALPDPMLRGQLRETLAALPEKQRMIVVLRYQEDLGPAEIAELLEMPVNTVKSTLHRSLEELRRLLTRRLGEIRYALF